MEPTQFCPRCGQLLSHGLCPSCGIVGAPAAGTPGSAQGSRIVLASVAVYLVIGLVALTFVAFRLSAVLKRNGSFGRAAVYAKHNGPVARLDELKGSGRIYLVQIGPHSYSYSLDDLANWLHTKYALDVRVLPATRAYDSAWNAERGQYIAQNLYEQLKQEHSDIAADENAYLIGFTDADMYGVDHLSRGTFTERDLDRTAVISLEGMEDRPRGASAQAVALAKQTFQARVRRILLKDVAILYWHLPTNNDFTSLLHNPLDPNLPTEDIYESDLDPARARRGETVDEPCVDLRYSAQEGVRPLPGPFIRSCANLPSASRDTASEYFELDLRIGLLMDKRTDIYAYDTIPIVFERMTRDGWKGINPLGISGSDNYDGYLSSADNIQIDVADSGGQRVRLTRDPKYGLPLSMVKYVDLQNPGFYEMRWKTEPYQHYELRRFDGAVESYLPCLGSHVWCYLTDYRDPRGDELHFERDSGRHLLSLTSPHGSWAHITNDSAGRMVEVTSSTGAFVRYGYDDANRLVSVNYSSGEVCRYEYDSTQHLLTFSGSPDAKTPLRVWLRNEYENGLVVRQTLADGSVYAYRYDSADPTRISSVSAQTSDGRHFTLQIGPSSTTVYESGSAPSAAGASR